MLTVRRIGDRYFNQCDALCADHNSLYKLNKFNVCFTQLSFRPLKMRAHKNTHVQLRYDLSYSYSSGCLFEEYERKLRIENIGKASYPSDNVRLLGL
jgi:hypothetical protein